jgi:parvulin-like peptidyl-prolyl isomerase
MAKKVLAKVGDHTITLGDYAEALERMDQFERLRYQTPDRRKQLLDEMVNVELLAIEAKRRGLDELPETKELVRQSFRDELLRQTRAKLPPLDQLPMADVRAYYESHKADFDEPERRRLSLIVVASEAQAKTILARAKEATAESWGALVKQYSLAKGSESARTAPPPELAGDVGMVNAPDSGQNDNPRVPEPVRSAAFEIDGIGTILDRVVSVGGRHYVVRLTSKSAARSRTLEEAERTIRVKILREKIRQAEEDLERELREQFPVKVDEAALQKVQIPAATPSARPKPGP